MLKVRRASGFAFEKIWKRKQKRFADFFATFATAVLCTFNIKSAKIAEARKIFFKNIQFGVIKRTGIWTDLESDEKVAHIRKVKNSIIPSRFPS